MALTLAVTICTAVGDGLKPLAEHAYVKASSPGEQDNFGQSVALSGDTMAVGAPFAEGGNGALDSSGLVYIYERGSDGWRQDVVLEAPNAEAGDRFGWSVGLSGDTLVVGAIWEDSVPTEKDSVMMSDNSGNNTGAAYVFVRTEGGWELQGFLKASVVRDTSEFGYSVAIDGDVIVVGTPLHDSSLGGEDFGTVNMFHRVEESWVWESAFSGIDEGDEFGRSIAVEGDTLVVGTPGEDRPEPNSGVAHVFTRQESGWEWDGRLIASNGGTRFRFGSEGDQFGWSVAMSGGSIVIGAPREPSRNLQNESSVEDAGAAYVFVQGEKGWVEQAYLKASNVQAFDKFGWSVAIDGDTIAVAARDEGSSSTGVGGSQVDNLARRSGAAYLFSRSGIEWAQCAYVKASNTEEGDQFGRAMAISGNTLVVSAHEEDSSATGINGDGQDNGAERSGAAYVFAPPVDNLLPVTQIIRTPGEARFTIPRVPGRRIGLEYSPDMMPGTWVDLGNFSISGSVGSFIDTDSVRAGRERGFYRAFLRPE